MDDEILRRFFERMAEEADPKPTIPPRLLRRAGRRRARTVLVGVLVVALVGSGAFVGLQALTGIHRLKPAATACEWTATITPNPGNVGNSLAAVAAISSDDVWAVGSYGYRRGGYTPPPPNSIGGPFFRGIDHALVVHWDGRGWTRMEPPAPPGAEQGASLNGVLALSHDDVWVTGETALGGALYFEHWDGSTWSVVPTPVSGVNTWPSHDLAATGSRDVWFAGTRNDGLGTLRTLTMHWDGARWGVIPSPNLGSKGSQLTAVAAIAPDDAWAVGHAGHRPVGMHWDGAAWSIVPMPSDETFYQLEDVAAGPDGRLVAVGASYQTAGGRPQTLGLILTWDGHSWRIVERHPGTAFQDVVLASPDDAWIPARAGWDTKGPVTQVLLHWDGRHTETEAVPVLPAEGWIGGLATLPSGELWAVGNDPSGVPGRAIALHRPCHPVATPSSEPSGSLPTPSNPKTVATSLTVPWAPIPPTPVPSPTVDARPCEAGDLTVEIGLDGAGMSFAGGAGFENVSPTPCYVTGRPGVSLVGADGVELDIQIVPAGPGERWPEEPYVVLPPGGSALAFMVWRNWCGPRDDQVTWLIDLPGVGRFDVPGPGAGPFCNAPGEAWTLSVASVRPQDPPVEGKWPLASLIQGEFSVAPGSDLRYVVILHTAGDSYTFPADCPAYEETATLPDGTKASATYTLNCGEAGTFTSEVAVAFEMVLHIPADATPGVSQLHWALDPPWGTSKTVPLTITAP